MSRDELVRKAAKRGKYAPLYNHLSKLGVSEWRTSFEAIELILGFPLPDSARIHRPWWANQQYSGHSQSMAWSAAGWETAGVDMVAETLTFRRAEPV